MSRWKLAGGLPMSVQRLKGINGPNPCNLVESRSVESDNPRRTATSHVILGCSWMERSGGQTQSERRKGVAEQFWRSCMINHEDSGETSVQLHGIVANQVTKPMADFQVDNAEWRAVFRLRIGLHGTNNQSTACSCSRQANMVQHCGPRGESLRYRSLGTQCSLPRQTFLGTRPGQDQVQGWVQGCIRLEAAKEAMLRCPISQTHPRAPADRPMDPKNICRYHQQCKENHVGVKETYQHDSNSKHSSLGLATVSRWR